MIFSGRCISRNGFMLVEMLSVVVILAIVLSVSTPLLVTLIDETPKIKRVVEENRKVMSMLDSLRADVEAGRSLPRSAGNIVANEKRVLIETHDGGIVCYEHLGDIVKRRKLGDGTDNRPKTWTLRHANIQWRTWPSGAPVRAIEVRTCIVHTHKGITERKLANARLFFVAAAKGLRKDK